MSARVGIAGLLLGLWGFGWLASLAALPAGQDVTATPHWRRTATGWERVEKPPLPPFEPPVAPSVWAALELCAALGALFYWPIPRLPVAGAVDAIPRAVNLPNHRSQRKAKKIRVPEESLEPA